MQQMSGGQALVRQLRAEGVDTVFALPGVQIMAAFDALYEARADIRMVHVRHEQATTYMADGYSRATGKPGVAMVVPGPGALNATAGLGTAYASGSPVLLISGQIPTESLGKRQGQLHEVEDQLDVFKPITKWAHRVTRVEEVPDAVHEAFRQLTTGRPRPVELEVPPDTLANLGDADIIEPEEYPPAAVRARDIAHAVQMLTEAKSPTIIAGGGALSAEVGAELLELARIVQAPIMTTQTSKGVIDESDPHYVGTNYVGIGPGARVLAETDVLLAVGTRLAFRQGSVEKPPRIIQIDADPDEIGRNMEAELGIVADAKVALSQLTAQLRSSGVSKPPRLEQIEGYRNAFQAEIRELAPEQTAMIDTVRERLDDDAILVSGSTTVGYWSTLAYEVRQPRTYVTSGYFGTLGYAFPTALGSKVGAPDKQVVALAGDGGFMYSPQELSTAVRYGINVVTVVFNNGMYGASRWDQTHRYGERFIGTDLANPDFVKLAESFGAVGMRTNPDGFGDALTKALDANAPVLLEVEVPNMMPPFQIVS
ncbi:MAG: thiamine pyrophosphate-binding protein [SAR202 cluster bacterium]|jgi:acetolactate synthase-1/2/3 large subunit|nr:thiamine pyrophosphate-binding protein [Chloroflexota bacterium]MDP6419808.1 thiamine pyrophosphate-binding protein [SAR202 cluster bacterium]HAL48132.1 thiamine pyrophosphate-binding protein [Dehalococcoidia bacterium]MDP6662580.1 thiamine pyrophosphate-binding protein [SAR202 cluster bacterium]MDP6798401.1 thiamine pyrophosphate-binding protein [SAR202 cluster bacterium]|tara:strand:- start:3039 stop:4658 length:1620 start_codon:yes stop_codon:yes gene_type:complete